MTAYRNIQEFKAALDALARSNPRLRSLRARTNMAWPKRIDYDGGSIMADDPEEYQQFMMIFPNARPGGASAGSHTAPPPPSSSRVSSRASSRSSFRKPSPPSPRTSSSGREDVRPRETLWTRRLGSIFSCGMF